MKAGKYKTMKVKFILNKIILSSIIFAILLMVACKVTKPYVQPANIISSKLYRDSLSTDTSNIAAVSWKEIFGDSLLESLIQEGIQNNLDLKIASARIKAASANFKQSRLAFLPGFDLNIGGSFQKYPSSQTGPPEAYQLSLSSTWEADIWGKLSSAKRANLASLLQSNAYRNAIQTQLIADIASNYYLLLAYDEQLKITEKTVANRIQEVVAVRLLKESNVVTGAAVVQSEANRYSVEITIPDLKQHLHETENSISLLLGRNPNSVIRSTLNEQVIKTHLATGVPLQLLANRPDVQEAELQLRKSFEVENVARTYFYPSLFLTANSGLSSGNLAQLFNPASFFAGITGGILQPIFNKGLNKQRLALAQAAQEESLAAFKQKIIIAGQEVSNALYNYKSAVDKQLLRTQQIIFLQKSVDYTRELLKYSSATNYTDVLTSEQSLLAGQLNGINDKLQQLTAMVTLYRSLGGGWK